MNPERLVSRVAPTGRVSIRLGTAQRDLFARSADTPRNLACTLRNAPVRDGKLSVRVTRPELASLIAIAARAPAEGKREERELATLVRYLEGIEDRFRDPGPDSGPEPESEG